MYEIKTEDAYEVFSKDKEMFDFSNYSVKSKYYDDSNKLVAGNIKDETGGEYGINEYRINLVLQQMVLYPNKQ